MLQKSQPIALYLTATVFNLVIQSSTPAATIFWDLELFNESGTQVGNGEFSYDSETIDTILLRSLMGNSEITVETLLESISINLLGESIPINSETWWELNSANATKQIQGLGRASNTIINEWRFPTATPLDFPLASIFSLTGSSTESEGEGSWNFDGTEPLPFTSLVPESLRGLTISGRWEATLRDSSSQSISESDSMSALIFLGSFGVMTLAKKERT